MSKAEIMAELAHLSAQDLAEVRAWLDRLAQDKSVEKSSTVAPRVRSPRLANPSQSKDFVKQVRELPPHALL